MLHGSTGEEQRGPPAGSFLFLLCSHLIRVRGFELHLQNCISFIEIPGFFLEAWETWAFLYMVPDLLVFGLVVHESAGFILSG